MTLHATPTTTTCPVCNSEGSLIYAVVQTAYYNVKAIKKDDIDAQYHTTELDDERRLFCAQCHEYFEVPDNECLYG